MEYAQENIRINSSSIRPQQVLFGLPHLLLPLQIVFSVLSNDWMLLILRDHVSKAELSYFVEHLLPVAMTIRLKGLVTMVIRCAINKML